MRQSPLARRTATLASALLLCTCLTPLGRAAAEITSRIIGAIDSTDLTTLPGNTHPYATKAADQGLVDGTQMFRHLYIVLQRSAAQERALAAFNLRQYDVHSPDYHRWLQPEEFGSTYGPSGGDIAAVTRWLTSVSLNVDHITTGRVAIEVSGRAADVQNAFHLEMHRYLLNGATHVANDRNPQIPRALAPVVMGVAGLNDFQMTAGAVRNGYVTRDDSGRLISYVSPSPLLIPPSSGAAPDYTVPFGTFLDEFVTPYDLATIYNSLPLWNASKPILGSGITVAVVGDSNVNVNDIVTYRTDFKLPNTAATLDTIFLGTKPTALSFENTMELEMISAAAPGANLQLVVPENGTLSTYNPGTGGITTSGFISAVNYIVEQNKVNIVTSGYALCELLLGASSNQAINQLWQQAATSGISVFASTGSVGSAGCSTGEYKQLDTHGLQVSGIASSPFVTAVGGTDFNWPWITNGGTTYWTTTNDVHDASAKGYIPEAPWNTSCANKFIQEYQLNVAGGPIYPEVVDVCSGEYTDPDYMGLEMNQGGGGGASSCSSTDSSGNCSGYLKPEWQTGLGSPTDIHRDVPDVSLFASGGWPFLRGPEGNVLSPNSLIHSSILLICFSESINGNTAHACTYDGVYDHVIYQGVGGTNAATAYWAGIMALVEQKQGGARQGMPNFSLYKLWSEENLSACESSIVATGNKCVFYDIASPGITNSGPCVGKQTGVTSHPDCNYTQAESPNLQLSVGNLTGYAATKGYDQATGLGSVNITNLVNSWPSSAPTPAVTLNTTQLAFGSVAVGTSSASQLVIVINAGAVGVNLTNGGITLSGANPTAFSKTTDGCGATLEVEAFCTISVTFKPSAAGNASATLSIADNASGSPQKVALSGTGTAGGSGSPSITLSPSALSFGNQSVGSASATKSVSVTNSGKATLTFSSVSITGQADDFTLHNGCSGGLAAGASCSLSVAFKPVAHGAKSAAISIADNASGSPQTVALSGTGTDAGAAALKLSAASLAFGNVAVGSSSATKTVTLTNSGTAALTFSSISVTGQADDFSLTKGCGSSLAAGASCSLTIAFKPVAHGAKSAAISIADNASGSPQTVALSGTATSGTAPAVSLSATSLAFGNEAAGSASADKTVMLRNSGNATLTLSSITESGQADDFNLSNGCGGSLATGASCVLTIAFKPVSAGSKTATISITDNATGSPQHISLAGTGT